MTRRLYVASALWRATWDGLDAHGRGERESACVWLGTIDGQEERAVDVVFLDDLPGTVGQRLNHRTSREAVAELLSRARARGLRIVADLHTHPSDWVALSTVDRAHPIEYRVGLLALVLPHFAGRARVLDGVGVHEYVGSGAWKTMHDAERTDRVSIEPEEQ